MSATAIAAIAGLAPTVLDLVRRFIPDKDKQQEVELELQQIMARASDRIGDALVADARSADKFQSRWRPAIGWICVVGCALEFIAFPIINMTRGILGGPVIVSMLDAASLMALLTALLGMGTLRTVERIKGKV